jgi:LPXTG-site transpeptidase (sortase) family protein
MLAKVQLLALVTWCVVAGAAGVVLGYGVHSLFLAPDQQTQRATPPRALHATSALQEAPVTWSAFPSAGPASPVLEPGILQATGSVEPVPTAVALGIPIARVVIPAIGVNAPVVTKSLDPDRVMQSPDTPSEVAWYDFTSLPGGGGNVVLAGHADFAGVGPAVFWDLWRLQSGDLIQLHLIDGSVTFYRVVSSETVPEATAAIDEIIGPTSVEVVTLITCAGNYSAVTGRYDQRLVVRAERIALDGSPVVE